MVCAEFCDIAQGPVQQLIKSWKEKDREWLQGAIGRMQNVQALNMANSSQNTSGV